MYHFNVLINLYRAKLDASPIVSKFQYINWRRCCQDKRGWFCLCVSTVWNHCQYDKKYWNANIKYIFFLNRTNVDISRQMLTLLSPQPKPLPETIYLMSDVQFMDSNAWRLCLILLDNIVYKVNLFIFILITYWFFFWLTSQLENFKSQWIYNIKLVI